ncbi:MAG: terpene cyclase/mutase family protein [Planctomycetaceae bacterium]|nr:terpene cyclase/mutase family protein [Planctomycetaceae bacterium]
MNQHSESESSARLSRRFALRAAIGGGVAISSGWRSLVPADENAATSEQPRHVTNEAITAIQRGLNWLSTRQSRDGGFGDPRSYARNVGVCALAGLAFLAQRGVRSPYQEQIESCLRYLLGRRQTNGWIVEEHICTHAPLYGHGFATLFLGQLYGEIDSPALRDALHRAVGLILQLQQPNGAWRYTADPEDADTSVTTCQMMALFSASQAGISIPQSAIDRSIEFLRQCQNPDGGFRYRLSDPPESLFPRSAAAVAALTCAGLKEDPATIRAREYLHQARRGVDAASDGLAEYFYYGCFHAAHAAWLGGEQGWDNWFPQLRDELLFKQSADGSWHDPNIGNEYATAMALIVLQFPLANIPLFAIR